MNKRYIVLFLIILLQTGMADSYFVRLSDAGLEKKEALLSSANVLSKSARAAQFKAFNTTPKSPSWLQRWMTLDAPGDSLPRILKKEGLIDRFEPVGRFRTMAKRPDSLYNAQWYLNKLQAPLFWNITRGSQETLVAIIDTGIDYNHPQLTPAIWKNEPEWNGEEGVDDDGNGYVDDRWGWDFTDAPRFPDGGDYLDEDNDAMDEFGSGHGTQIAGIIAATHESEGVRGLAPDIKIMNLRAGTASGYLEEDDVARAILYAIDNGAHIINMSFGDTALSEFLRQVIVYAYQKGITMIASAGNSGTQEWHYPSALGETISVGASTPEDHLAGFSSYGSTIDLIAPGTDIVSTAVGGGYNTVNGTSFSAAMVTAAAALLISSDSEFSPQHIRNILKTTSEDILRHGWDRFSGNGRLNILAALQLPNHGVLEIALPQPGSAVCGDSVTVTGTLAHPDLKMGALEFGLGDNPVRWQEIRTLEQRQIVDDTIGVFALPAVSDTTITLRLGMQLWNGNRDETRSTIHIDCSPPRISEVQILPMYKGYQRVNLVRFKTDDICSAVLNVQDGGQNEPISLNYKTRNHHLIINVEDWSSSAAFTIIAKNASGLETMADNNGAGFTFKPPVAFEMQAFTELPFSLPSGYLLDHAVDLNQNGKKEVVLSRYDSAFRFGPVEIYEFDGDGFQKSWQSDFTAIPRDAGDVDGDGLSDILLSYGNRAYIVEANVMNGFPQQVVWQDTSGLWVASYEDVDRDGNQEIVGYEDSTYLVIENTADNRFEEIARLENRSSGNNQLTVPRVITMDIDNDGRCELFFSDADGDLQMYTSQGDNRFFWAGEGKMALNNSASIISGYRENAETPLLWTASHTSHDFNSEHLFDARHWILEQFHLAPKIDRLFPEISVYLQGYADTKDFDSGLKVVRWDGTPYIFASLFPDIYIFELEGQVVKPVWHKSDARSNTVLVDDLNQDGHMDFMYNNGERLVAYSRTAVDRPLRPYPFDAQALDSIRARLDWGAVSGADFYNLYRKEKAGEWRLMARTDTRVYHDSTLIGERLYYYRVTAIDSSRQTPESLPSQTDSVVTSPPPRLLSAQPTSAEQLILTFNEPVQLLEENPWRITLSSTGAAAVSAVVFKEKKQLLTAFEEPFKQDRRDSVQVRHVYDLQEVPIDRRYDTGVFVYEKQQRAPYLEKIDYSGRYHIRLTFSKPMAKTTLQNKNNYRIEPSGEVKQIVIADDQQRRVDLTLSKKTMAGAFGVASYLILENLRSVEGRALKETGKIKLFQEADDLSEMFVYPQPVKPEHERVIFANLPSSTEISIYTMQGRKVCRLKGNVQHGGLAWELKDHFERDVHSGVYVYMAEYKSEQKIGKLMIVR